MTNWIRYIACTDDSPIGRVALMYLKAMCTIAPVRLVSLEQPVGLRWEPYAKLMAPRMNTTGPYVNVVCAPRTRWAWRQSTPVPDITGWVELYTAGVRNVLIAPTTPPTALEPETMATVMKYEAVAVPIDMYSRWSAIRPVRAMSASSIPVDLLRQLIVG